MVSESDSLKFQPKSLETKEENGTPSPHDWETEIRESKYQTDLQIYQNNVAVEESRKDPDMNKWILFPPNIYKKPRKKRYVGNLETAANIEREIAAIYKEAYYGLVDWSVLARATYALDTLLRSKATKK